MTAKKTEYEVVWPVRDKGNDQNGKRRVGMVVPSGTDWEGRHGRRPRRGDDRRKPPDEDRRP